jgi:hypothetical protein
MLKKNEACERHTQKNSFVFEEKKSRFNLSFMRNFTMEQNNICQIVQINYFEKC